MDVLGFKRAGLRRFHNSLASKDLVMASSDTPDSLQ